MTHSRPYSRMATGCCSQPTTRRKAHGWAPARSSSRNRAQCGTTTIRRPAGHGWQLQGRRQRAKHRTGYTKHVEEAGSAFSTWLVTPVKSTCRGPTRERHAAFLSVRAGQQLTGLSPPVWVWTDGTQLAGLWCLLMTTYHTNVSLALPMDTIIETGLVPMSIVHKVSDY